MKVLLTLVVALAAATGNTTAQDNADHLRALRRRVSKLPKRGDNR